MMGRVRAKEKDERVKGVRDWTEECMDWNM